MSPTQMRRDGLVKNVGLQARSNAWSNALGVTLGVTRNSPEARQARPRASQRRAASPRRALAGHRLADRGLGVQASAPTSAPLSLPRSARASASNFGLRESEIRPTAIHPCSRICKLASSTSTSIAGHSPAESGSRAGLPSDKAHHCRSPHSLMARTSTRRRGASWGSHLR